MRRSRSIGFAAPPLSAALTLAAALTLTVLTGAVAQPPPPAEQPTPSAQAPAQAAEPRASAQGADRVSDEITVFESQVTLDPTDLGMRDRQRLKADQILVLEGGAPRRVTNVQGLGSGGWRFLIYFDAELSRARTIRLASLRLGENAKRLTDLGSVEIVVADPEPRRMFGPSRESLPLAEQLAKLAESGQGTDQLHDLRQAYSELEPTLAATDPRRNEALRREVDLVRRRVDPLLARLAEGCDSEPCALLLVSDGFYENPESFYLGEKRLTDPSEPHLAEEASRELAQTAAAYEWIAFPLPLREDRLEAPDLVGRQTTDFDVFLDHTGAVQRAPKRSDREPKIDLEKLEVSVTPILQPLQRLAVESAGEVVRIADDLNDPLDRLPDRRRVYYLTDRPADGDLRPFSARQLEGSTELKTPAWVRSSTPAAVAGSRVRAMLTGAKLEGPAPVRCRIERSAAGGAELVIDADWGENEVAPKSTIRVSVGYARPGDQAWVGHQRVLAGEVAAGGAWQHRLALSLPQGVGQVAVVAEALAPRVWGAAVVQSAP